MRENELQYPIPENEAERLKALHAYEVLDSPPEIDFDVLTRIATKTFHTPAAVVGLLDSNRIWFKSVLGLDVPQLDRQLAFCAYSVMQPGSVLVIEDLLEDERFKNNPLVVEPPFVRFYAGAPIVDPNGYALGTIAVVDIKPRIFDKNDQSLLLDLSVLAMTALENRRRASLLTQLALTDYLTGVANRAQFDRALEAELAYAKRSNEAFSVLCLDLDCFKDINDCFGHPAGDEVLCEVASRLKQQLRTEDTVSRLGGDEFGMIIREGSDASAQSLAQRIQQVMSVPVTLADGTKIDVGISIGMATYTNDIDSPYTLLAKADSDLYRAKRRAGKIR